ncbi:hypothetical protein R6Q57_017584 [Mikania cordata]
MVMACPQFLSFLGLLLFVVTFSYNLRKRSNTTKNAKLKAPEPSGALPLIGHLHFLRGQAPLARILGKIADDYGPVYSLRLGFRQALVVSSSQMIKECFTTNDINFASRPNLAISRHMVYDHAGFALAMDHTGEISEKWSRNNEDLHVKQAITRDLYVGGVFVVSDFFSCLEWMDIGGHVKAMKQVAKEVDSVIEKWLDEHIEKRKLEQADDVHENIDFMDLMLSTTFPKEVEMSGHDRQTVIKATTMVVRTSFTFKPPTRYTGGRWPADDLARGHVQTTTISACHRVKARW